jgi:hypothetical protein
MTENEPAPRPTTEDEPSGVDTNEILVTSVDPFDTPFRMPAGHKISEAPVPDYDPDERLYG